jgi:hypothetical protein
MESNLYSMGYEKISPGKFSKQSGEFTVKLDFEPKIFSFVLLNTRGKLLEFFFDNPDKLLKEAQKWDQCKNFKTYYKYKHKKHIIFVMKMKKHNHV